MLFQDLWLLYMWLFSSLYVSSSQKFILCLTVLGRKDMIPDNKYMHCLAAICGMCADTLFLPNLINHLLIPYINNLFFFISQQVQPYYFSRKHNQYACKCTLLYSFTHSTNSWLPGYKYGFIKGQNTLFYYTYTFFLSTNLLVYLWYL